MGEGVIGRVGATIEPGECGDGNRVYIHPSTAVGRGIAGGGAGGVVVPKSAALMLPRLLFVDAALCCVLSQK